MLAPSSAPAIDRENVGPQLEAFFDALAPADISLIHDLTDQARVHGGRLFNRALPGMLSSVPVILDDEPTPIVQNRLELLSSQRPLDGPHQPAFMIASNAGAGSKKLKRQNLDLIQRFGSFCEDREIPFSHFVADYPPGTPIGRVRAVMHAVGMNYHREQAASQQSSPRDILMVSSDVDTQHTRSDYQLRLDRLFRHGTAAAWLGGPVVRHAGLGPEFPRINNLLAWYSLHCIFLTKMMAQNFAVNVGAYADIGGIDPSASIGEVGGLRRRLERQFQDDYDFVVLGPPVVVSGRQLISRIVDTNEQALDYGELSTPSGRRHSYRKQVVAADISPDRYRAALKVMAGRTLAAVYDEARELALDFGDSPEDATKLALERVRLRARVALAMLGDFDGAAAVIDENIRELERLNRTGGSGRS